MFVQAALALALLMVMVAISLQMRGREGGARRLAVALGTLGGMVAGLVIGGLGAIFFGEPIDDVSGLRRPLGPFAKGAGASPPPGPAAKGTGPTSGGPNPKTQLATLVQKLDQLVDHPVNLELGPEARASLRRQLQGVEKFPELTREEAKTRLDAIHELLRDQRPTLEAAGYRWPGGGAGGGRGMMGPMMGPSDPPNPFQETDGSSALLSLRERLPAS